MKKRIKMDTALLSLFVIMVGFLFLFRNFYPAQVKTDNILDFVGAIILFKGIMFRMAARGHKKMHSDKGHSLVTSGPYAISRNPMYLGTFLISIGGILMIWPWWCVFLYAGLFYLRFNREMEKEEVFLKEKFGLKYEEYCQQTPRIFPSIKKSWQMRTRDIFDLKLAFSTQEKRLLVLAPIVAVIVETFQELMIFGQTHLRTTINIIGWAAICFALVFWIFYQKR